MPGPVDTGLGLPGGALLAWPLAAVFQDSPVSCQWLPQVTILPSPGLQSGANPSQLESHRGEAAGRRPRSATRARGSSPQSGNRDSNPICLLPKQAR